MPDYTLPLAAALKDDQLTRQLKGVYRRYMHTEPDSTQLFLWVLRAVTRGPRSAISAARKSGRRERATPPAVVDMPALRNISFVGL